MSVKKRYADKYYDFYKSEAILALCGNFVNFTAKRALRAIKDLDF